MSRHPRTSDISRSDGWSKLKAMPLGSRPPSPAEHDAEHDAAVATVLRMARCAHEAAEVLTLLGLDPAATKARWVQARCAKANRT